MGHPNWSSPMSQVSFGTWGTSDLFRIDGSQGEFGGFAEADDSGDVFGTGAALAFVGAAEEERLDLGSAADVEGSDSLGRVHLVAGDGEQITADLLDVDRELSGCLNGISVEVNVGLGGDLADLFDRLDCSGLVVGHHEGDELGVGPEGAADVGGIDDAVAAYRKKCHLDATLCQALGGVENGVVFDGEVMRWSPGWMSPKMARLSPSVPPLVKTISAPRQPSRAATRSRAISTAARACWPW